MAEHIAVDDRVSVRVEDERREGEYGHLRPRANVGALERAASALAGGALLIGGLRRRSKLGVAQALLGAELIRRGATGECRLYRALGWSATPPRGFLGAPPDARDIEEQLFLDAPAQRLYDLWRQPATIRDVMAHFATVTTPGPDRLHWVLHAPLGQSFEWETWTVEDRPGELIRWESLPGSDIPNEGWVEFRRSGESGGTDVALHMRFDPPGGVLGDMTARIAGIVPERFVRTALQRFQELAITT